MTAPSPQELFKRLSPSVFVLEALSESGSVVATGSGVAVAPDEVVTNKHVIEEGMTWRIKRGRETWPATLTHLDPDHDLCQLKADGLKAPPVPVRGSSTLTVGERVYAIGAPEGLELTLSEGLISGLREYEQARLIQTSAAISPGSSGGGLFDTNGRLVGITTFYLKEGQNLNFALPGEWVRMLATQQLSEKQKTEISPAFRALQWFQFGWEASEAGDYEKAVKDYREVVRLKPDDAPAWNNLGVAYRHLGQSDQAVKAYGEAVRLKPDDARVWKNLGSACNDLKQYDQAVKAYGEAVRLKPDDAEAWNNLGSAYGDLNQHDQALRAHQEAVRLKPDYARAWDNLGIDYSHLNQNDQAVRAYGEVVRLKPDDAAAWYVLGLAYVVQGNRSKVMQVYETLKTLDKKRADEFFQKFVLP